MMKFVPMVTAHNSTDMIEKAQVEKKLNYCCSPLSPRPITYSLSTISGLFSITA